MAESLRDVLDRIRKERGLTQKDFASAIQMGMGTFYAWQKDPDAASDKTLRKIREFTENPDLFLKSSVTKPKEQKGSKQSKQSRVSEVTSEMLWAFANTDRADLAFVGEVLKIVGKPSISINQAKALIELRHKELPKK
jgi:transcriptional regulator with XRE-family HTH domain